MEGVKLPGKAATKHGPVHAFGTVRGPHEEHTDEIGVGPVGMQAGGGPEGANTCGSEEPAVLLLHNEDVAVVEEQQINDLFRDPHTAECRTQGGNGVGGDQCYEGQENGI